MKKRGKHRLDVSTLWNAWEQKKTVSVIMTLLIVCGLVFYAMGMRQKQELTMYQNRVTLFQRERQFYTYEDAEQMQQRNDEAEEPLSYAVWGTEGMHLLENQDLGRSTRVEVYAVEGNSQLLLSSTAMLDGTIANGCLLGERAAQDLFGVADATGLAITMDGKTYRVLGMLNQKAQGAVFSAEDLQASRLDRMTIQTSENSTLSVLEQTVEWKTGFTGTAFDYRFMISVVGLLSAGLCILLWLWLLRLMFTEWREYRKQYMAHAEYYKNGYRIAPAYIKGTAVRIACIAGVILVMVFFLRSHAKIPEDMIPTKWSDFAFWSRWFADKAERMSDWIRCEKYSSELEYLGRTGRAMVCFCISYLCYLLIRIFRFGMKRSANGFGGISKHEKEPNV